ncbi:sensor domain-containing diguanylate cyclase [uncultured Rhodospira sp.]|uniref:sensor domain-containing diguanylate cyclase n=1 Tax=uncultured Rhodospira sp. TaxID=1936189 RepID=UPI00260C247F|nr:sensor domain-containing diguanylate cyclase [uncultured Rhodospira sp.]
MVHGNAEAGRLTPLLNDPEIPGGLPQVVRRALDTGTPAMCFIPALAGGSRAGLDLTVLPLNDRQGVAILAQDTTLETALYGALADSRTRYKDFVALACDVAWETGQDGRFVFVAPPDALGYGSHALLHTDPADLLDPRERRDVAAVFRTRSPVRSVELWARLGDGQAVCLLVSAVPLFDSAGDWIGARGVCRDITEQREQDRALRRAHHREQVRARVVQAFRDELDVGNILTVAAEALAKGTGARGCQILRRDHPPGLADKDKESQPVALADLILGGDYGEAAPPLSDLSPTLTPDTAPWEAAIGAHSVIVLGTSHHKVLNGAIVAWRRAERGPWTEDDRRLIRDVADQVGLANEQIGRYETVMTLSRTDPLTGLLNRRAFLEDIERRQKRMERQHETAALLYVDLDNFKLVNDYRGHAQGDQVLVMVAEILDTKTRPTDLVARIGGDEFAVWLEAIDEAGAQRKAREVLETSVMLSTMSANPAHPLALSVGIAVYDPARPETGEALTHRADAAMYAAKLMGKGQCHLAAPAPVWISPGDA